MPSLLSDFAVGTPTPWPPAADFTPGKLLLHNLDSDGKDEFLIRNGGWPYLSLPDPLPVHVIMVCAVTLHRGELKLPEEDEDGNIPIGEVPGFEFSGYVVSTSPRSPYYPGTEIWYVPLAASSVLNAAANVEITSGRTSFKRTGNARTYMVAKFHEIAMKPIDMTWEQGATVPIGGLMAFQALFGYKLLFQPALRDWGSEAWRRGYNIGKSLLITGAATPAGVWAVQFARLAGVGRIVATCPLDQMDLVRRLGAHEVYDWSVLGVRGWNRGLFSIVLDFVGGETLSNAWMRVGPSGKILSAVDDTAKFKAMVVNPGISHFNFLLAHSQKQVDIISSLSRRGIVRAVLDPQDVFEFEDFKAALERLRTNPRGQVVLRMSSLPPHPLIHQLKEIQGARWDDKDDFNSDKLKKSRGEDEPENIGALGKWAIIEDSNPSSLLALATAARLMTPLPWSKVHAAK